MSPDSENFVSDITFIRNFVETATGLTSRWNGVVHLTDEVRSDGSPMYRAKKNWDCSIALHLSFLDAPDFVITLIHEVLHSVRAGMTPTSFRDYRGYEEGVVERLTQLFAPRIMEAMNKNVSIDNRDAFDDFLLCLEQIRGIARMDTLEFYIGLLQTPLADREAVVVQWAKRQYVNESEARVLVRSASALRKLRGQR